MKRPSTSISYIGSVHLIGVKCKGVAIAFDCHANVATARHANAAKRMATYTAPCISCKGVLLTDIPEPEWLLGDVDEVIDRLKVYHALSS